MRESGGDIHAAMSRRGAPFGAGLELTAKCNLDCVHCYHVRAAAPELNFPELRKLFRDLSALGVMELTVTGGEPLLRRDFFRILRHAAEERGFSVKIFSNLTLLDVRGAGFLARLPINRVETTLLGPDPVLHDSLTRRQGSFEATVGGIRMLTERGVRVRAKTMVLRRNRRALDDMYRLAGRLGIPFRHDDGVFVESDGGRAPLAQGISESEMLRDRRKRGRRPEREIPRSCNASRTMIHIAPDGAVFPCGPFPVPAGTVRETPLADIWRSAPLMERMRTLSDADYRVCRNCRYLPRCGGCVAMGHGLARGRMYPCRLVRKRLKTML